MEFGRTAWWSPFHGSLGDPPAVPPPRAVTGIISGSEPGGPVR
jgi:hypothetical protein